MTAALTYTPSATYECVFVHKIKKNVLLKTNNYLVCNKVCVMYLLICLWFSNLLQGIADEIQILCYYFVLFAWMCKVLLK